MMHKRRMNTTTTTTTQEAKALQEALAYSTDPYQQARRFVWLRKLDGVKVFVITLKDGLRINRAVTIPRRSMSLAYIQDGRMEKAVLIRDGVLATDI